MATLPSQEEAEAAQARVPCYAIFLACSTRHMPSHGSSSVMQGLLDLEIPTFVSLQAIGRPVWHAASGIVKQKDSDLSDSSVCSGGLCPAGKHPSGSANGPCDGDAVRDAAGAAVGRLQGVAGGARAHAPGQLAQVGHAQRGLAPPPPSRPPPHRLGGSRENVWLSSCRSLQQASWQYSVMPSNSSHRLARRHPCLAITP